MLIRKHLSWMLALLFVAGSASAQQSPTLDLAGEWRFAMDRGDIGTGEKWFDKSLSDHIKLPGILQGQGFGDDITVNTPWVAALPRDMRWFDLPQYAPYTKDGNVKMPYLSQPPKHYLGVAWYQRDIELPTAWAGKRIHLTLERPRWQTTAWIDDKPIGVNDSLVAPHEFEAGILSPGKHTLTIRIDNRMTVFPGYRPDGHGVSDALGGTWNGIVGKIELAATSPVYVDDAQVFPSIAKKSVTITVHIGNITGKPGSGALSVGKVSIPVAWTAAGADTQIVVPLGEPARLWDEFHPTLQHLSVQLKGDNADDVRELSFGFREISHNGKLLLLNNHEINLRLTHFGGDFPLTGYPATDLASWQRIIQTCKDFGLNGFRFHSWCPPEAAFEAADQMGFYIQPECGMWNDFSQPGMLDRLQAETARIERAYGNHPSFILLSPSNEPAGNQSMDDLVTWAIKWHRGDPRRLYSGGTGRSSDLPGASYVTLGDGLRGRVGWFGRDYSDNLPGDNVPVFAHEVGQWCAYPDFDEIKKYKSFRKILYTFRRGDTIF